MQGRVVLHADESTTDRTYNPASQPLTIGWIDNDEALANRGQADRDYWELAILTRENPANVEGGQPVDILILLIVKNHLVSSGTQGTTLQEEGRRKFFDFGMDLIKWPLWIP